jgi:hypothetical protein
MPTIDTVLVELDRVKRVAAALNDRESLEVLGRYTHELEHAAAENLHSASEEIVI